MKILTILLGYLTSTGSTEAALMFGTDALDKGDAEFVEALVISFLIVCVYLLFWLKNKGQY
ncbi:MAG: hypothetical protein ACU85E_02970 [Gammaproteobacteria bacterium]